MWMVPTHGLMEQGSRKGSGTAMNIHEDARVCSESVEEMEMASGLMVAADRTEEDRLSEADVDRILGVPSSTAIRAVWTRPGHAADR
jgi:hypothetical protein